MEFLIVSGLSGAGKSTVMSVLEDSGFFCVDNLPPLHRFLYVLPVVWYKKS